MCKGKVMGMQFFTTGELADELGQRVHVISHLISSRRLKPAIVAGGYRLFDRKVLDQLRAELSHREAAAAVRPSHQGARV